MKQARQLNPQKHINLKCCLWQALGGRLVFKTLRSGPALLTEAGQAVLPYCQQLVEGAGEACKAMQDFRLASTGVVSLGASQTVGTYLMPRLIAAFKKNNPEVCGCLHPHLDPHC